VPREPCGLMNASVSPRPVSALAVADDDVLATDVNQHVRADFAGEGAFFRGIKVLRPNRHGRPIYRLRNSLRYGNGGRRRR